MEIKYVLHGYNVVSPRLGLNGLFDGPFDLRFVWNLAWNIVRFINGYVADGFTNYGGGIFDSLWFIPIK